ncbi:MAG: amino acid ABC transporter permease [Acidaminococcaceae bacterium]|nr:amino acid ABC transporter permease [Acidaminococcaceae bacterium]MDO4935362.1 amino acid ABC transporter permease [Phascolarctobacterium sp.]
MDYDFIVNSIPLYVKAAELTLVLSFWGILFSMILGIVCAVVEFYKVPVLKTIVKVYVEISRNTPLLIQLFFLYYGLTQFGIRLEAETCAVVGLTFLGGSYMAEALRSGLDAVQKIQIESGLSIGLTKIQLMRYIILPQAVGVAVPSIAANAIFLMKETSVVSAIALADLMFVAKDLIGMYYRTSEALLMLVIAYLIILLPISIAFTLLERRLRRHGLGTNNI